jgi:type II secretion system protein G
MKFIKNNKGFTLIELLIVIAIIGVLSAFILANLIGAQARARDGQRKSDLRQIQAAFELYRADQNGYPLSLPGCNSSLTNGVGGTIYMQKMPCDPSTKQPYIYNPNGSGYSLSACLENTNDQQKDTTNICTTPPGTVSYTVNNP